MADNAKKILATVTVTGADDSVRPEDLVPIARKYPFVEFGILLSKKQQGTKRFPSLDWLRELYLLRNKYHLRLSGHLCGRWVRDMCLGKPSFSEDLGYIIESFGRLQLNFHAEPHQVDIGKLAELIQGHLPYKSIIFQMDGINEGIFSALGDGFHGVHIYPLFDMSGGNGVLPKQWPKQPANQFCGYAGGLSPDNLQAELEKISSVVHRTIWIDAETHLRSEDDKVFDLKEVRRFLEAAKPWVRTP